MRNIPMFAAALMMSVLAVPLAMADDDSGAAGHFDIHLRGVLVAPEAGGSVTVEGEKLPGSLSISDSFVPEIDGTYFLTDHIGFELIAATTQHSPHFSGVGDLGSVWLLPPTLTAKYYFDSTGAFRPYLGAGLNYTAFYSPRSGAVPGMKYSDSWGEALQAGIDIPVGDGPFFLNLDVKQIFLNDSVKADGGLVRAHAIINPFLFGTGVGIRL